MLFVAEVKFTSTGKDGTKKLYDTRYEVNATSELMAAIAIGKRAINLFRMKPSTRLSIKNIKIIGG